MKPVFAASYQGTHRFPLGLVNKGIRALDKADYSHTEVIIGDPLAGPVNCVSSVGVDGGVRGKDMQLHRADWDFLPLPWVQADDVTAWLEKHKGSKYDFWGTGRFALPFLMREHPESWFCSEVGATLARFEQPWRYTPQGYRNAVHSVLALHYPDLLLDHKAKFGMQS